MCGHAIHTVAWSDHSEGMECHLAGGTVVISAEVVPALVSPLSDERLDKICDDIIGVAI